MPTEQHVKYHETACDSSDQRVSLGLAASATPRESDPPVAKTPWERFHRQTAQPRL
jgi:hypothetical protein